GVLGPPLLSVLANGALAAHQVAELSAAADRVRRRHHLAPELVVARRQLREHHRAGDPDLTEPVAADDRNPLLFEIADGVLPQRDEAVVTDDGDDAFLLHHLLHARPVTRRVATVVAHRHHDRVAVHAALVVDPAGPDLHRGETALEHLTDEARDRPDGTDLDGRLLGRCGRRSDRWRLSGRVSRSTARLRLAGRLGRSRTARRPSARGRRRTGGRPAGGDRGAR